jgi:CheY-like chemotaxis protein
MPGMTGLELHNRLVGSGNIIPTILITAYPDDGDRARALRAGVICYLVKPFNYNDLRWFLPTCNGFRSASRSKLERNMGS